MSLYCAVMSSGEKLQPPRWRGVVLVLGLALAVRLVYLLIYRSLPEWGQLTVDNYYHLHWAESIARGNLLGDTTYFRAPFYTWCLGALFGLFGSSLWVARILGMVIGLASVATTYLLGRRLLGKTIGLLAALLYACFPVVIYFEQELLLDPLFTLLLQLAVLWLLRWVDGSRTGAALTFGLLLGAATITRPTALVLLPMALVVAAFKGGPRQQRLVQATVAAAGTGVLVALVFVRNILIAGDTVLVSSQGGINFYIGNHEHADGVSAALPEPMGHNWEIRQITHEAEETLGRDLLPGEVSQFWLHRGWSWITDNPVECLALVGKKLLHAVSDREISNNRSLPLFYGRVALLKYNPLSFGLIFAFAALGIIDRTRRNDSTRLIVALIVVYLLVISIFFFTSRFRYPLMPYWIILASGGFMSLVERFRRGIKPTLVFLTPALAIGMLSFANPVTLAQGTRAQELVAAGNHQYAAGLYAQALATFQAAAARDSTFPEVNLNTGACFLRLGNPDSARAHFSKEKRLHPQRAKAYSNLASLDLLEGRIDRSLALADSALSRAPYDPIANRVKLRALNASSNATDSLFSAAMNRALQQTDDDIYVCNEAAGLLVSRGMTTEALRVLLLATTAKSPPIETDDEAFRPDFRNSPPRWNNERAKAYFQLGYLHGLKGRYSQAVDCSKRAIDLDSNLVEAYVNVISGLASLGRHQEADSVFREAQRRFPNHEHVRGLWPN